MEINLKILKPYKRLGKGSEGIVIMTDSDKYTVKIYRLMIRIINYLQKYNIPTIYKSYRFLSKKNSLERYINELPEYFSYKNLLKSYIKNENFNDELKKFKKNYSIFINNKILKNQMKK